MLTPPLVSLLCSGLIFPNVHKYDKLFPATQLYPLYYSNYLNIYYNVTLTTQLETRGESLQCRYSLRVQENQVTTLTRKHLVRMDCFYFLPKGPFRILLSKIFNDLCGSKGAVALGHLRLRNFCTPSYSMRTLHSWSKKIPALGKHVI